jgi:hypothetical protein
MDMTGYEKYKTSVEDTGDRLARLRKTADLLIDAELQVAAKEEELREAKDARNHLAEVVIPEAMAELELEEITTTNGDRIKIDKKVRASIGNRKAAAFKWLVENGHGGIIKRSVRVHIGREADDVAAKLKAALTEGGYTDVAEEMEVAPATLTATIKNLLDEGVDVPKDTFGVFDQKVAKISKSKK